jgi:hypothetical protein
LRKFAELLTRSERRAFEPIGSAFGGDTHCICLGTA